MKNGGQWTERHFTIEGGGNDRSPQVGDMIIAFDTVYVRIKVPVWDDNSSSYISGPIVGYIKSGDKLQVVEATDCNSNNPNTKDSWIWVRIDSLPKR